MQPGVFFNYKNIKEEINQNESNMIDEINRKNIVQLGLLFQKKKN